MQELRLTRWDAYRLIDTFLDHIFQNWFSDYKTDFLDFLSSTHLLSDGISADPAYWSDWKNTCCPNESVTAPQALESLICLMNIYISLGDPSLEVTRVRDAILTNPKFIEVLDSIVSQGFDI